VSRPFLILFATLDLLFLVAGKLILRLGARRVRRRGFNYRTFLIVGINPRSEEVAQIIAEHPHWGLKLVGFVAPNGEHTEEVAGIPVLGSADDLPEILQNEVVDEVIFVLARRQLEEFEESFLLCSELGIRARVALYFPHMKARVVLEALEGIPLLTFTNTPGAPFPMFIKRLQDLTVSTLGIALTAPLVPFIATAIKLGSRGPVFYSQIRCGLNGRRFKLLKFRTMYEGSDERLDEVAKLTGLADRLDDRVGSLSGGLARRADLLRAMMVGPELLILDEPAAGLDRESHRAIIDTLDELRKRMGVAIVLSTHDLADAARADRVFLLREGLLVASGRPSELVERLDYTVVLETAGDSGEIRCDREEAKRHAADLLAQGVSYAVRDASLEDVYDGLMRASK